MIFDLNTHERIGTIRSQKPDILSLIFVTPDRLLVGQVDGFIDIVKFVGNQAHVTHSLQISEAGDINQLCLTSKDKEVMIGCAKGLLLCVISKNEQLEILRPEVEFSNRYIVELVHCGNNSFIVACSRPFYLKSNKIPPGETNFPIITYTYFMPEERDPEKKITFLGQYKSTDEQATFPVSKVAVASARGKTPVTPQQQQWIDAEAQYKNRFYLTIVDKHLKMIDTKLMQMVDLLTEPNYDEESLAGMGLCRRASDKVYHMLILCKSESGNYI